MASLDQLKGTFFDECSEALQQIELGLSDLREGTASDDTINAVFRSVHSVKGGAGIFGFDDLVKFAHVLETVLDAMRSGKMPSSQDIIDTLLQANDVLSDLIGMSRSGEAIPSDYGSGCRVGLERILQANSPGDEWGAGGSDDMADFEGIDFVPVRADEFDSEDHPPAEQEYRIVFRPKPELLKKANEPLYILRELRRLGTLALSVETERLPLLTELEPDRPYLGWTGTLQKSTPVDADSRSL
jgi:two-component system, chemotaxis family, sensor kinase CheA